MNLPLFFNFQGKRERANVKTRALATVFMSAQANLHFYPIQSITGKL